MSHTSTQSVRHFIDSMSQLTREELRRRFADEFKLFSGAANDAHVTNFSDFNRRGLNALYGGEERAGQLDEMGRIELALNTVRVMTAHLEMERLRCRTPASAAEIHRNAARKVRLCSIELNGLWPERLSRVERRPLKGPKKPSSPRAAFSQLALPGVKLKAPRKRVKKAKEIPGAPCGM
jgi:hypothetical protein